MELEDVLGILPEQYTGKEIIGEATIEVDSNVEADALYEKAKERLLHVNNWHNVAGFVSAVFHLFDANGQPVSRQVQQGDYIRIDIPGPGSSEGDGYDWVKVEALSEIDNYEIRSAGFRVRPTAKPFDGTHIAHFYDQASTSSFIVSKQQQKVLASVIDRNINPNNDNASLLDQVRHVAVALGAIGMFSKAQWQNLANGLVERT